MNQQLVPFAAVLIKEQNWLSGWANSRFSTRRLDLHESDQAVYLGFARSKFRQNASEANRFFAQRWSNPAVARSSGITFIENQVNNLEH
jgi:hypothetical protein